MRKLCHPRIVSLIEEQDSPEWLFLVMELVSGVYLATIGTLNHFIINNTPMISNRTLLYYSHSTWTLFIFLGGDLFDSIAAASKFSEPQARLLIGHLTSAIAYLHSLSIVHRDIKPENLLVRYQLTILGNIWIITQKWKHVISISYQPNKYLVN